MMVREPASSITSTVHRERTRLCLHLPCSGSNLHSCEQLRAPERRGPVVTTVMSVLSHTWILRSLASAEAVLMHGREGAAMPHEDGFAARSAGRGRSNGLRLRSPQVRRARAGLRFALLLTAPPRGRRARDGWPATLAAPQERTCGRHAATQQLAAQLHYRTRCSFPFDFFGGFEAFTFGSFSMYRSN